MFAKFFSIFFIFIPFVAFSNKYQDLHIQIFKHMIDQKMNIKSYDYIFFFDEYYISEGGGAGVAPGPPPVFYVNDTMKNYTIEMIKRYTLKKDNIFILDSLPCQTCPIRLYAKSLILKNANRPELSRFIEIGLPIEGWKSLTGLNELIYCDEDHENVILTFPVFTLEWYKPEPHLEFFRYSVTKKDGHFNLKFLEKW